MDSYIRMSGDITRSGMLSVVSRDDKVWEPRLGGVPRLPRLDWPCMTGTELLDRYAGRIPVIVAIGWYKEWCTTFTQGGQ